jgi:nucleoside triphosphate diphosphatase
MSTPGEAFDRLVSIMVRLRGPDGCPWDRVQTLATLRPFLLEETYEALEALDRADPAALREELGDLLFEVVFLARVAEESGDFSIEDAISDAAAKLVRRHPHVFGDDPSLRTAEEVQGKWEEMKAAEAKADGGRKTLLGGVPRSLPSLLRAYEYGSRAAAVGFDWVRAGDVLDKIEEEVRELREAAADWHGGGEPPAAVVEELGDLLFAMANLARKLGVEPEAALRQASNKFLDRFTKVERYVAARGERLQDRTLEELEALWQKAKRE